MPVAVRDGNGMQPGCLDDVPFGNISPRRSIPQGKTTEVDVTLPHNDWSLSLSDSELDLLIYLKELVITKTKNAGCGDLANKFDLRMLHGLGGILLAYLKEDMRKISPSCAKGFKPLDVFHKVVVDNERSCGFGARVGYTIPSKVATPKQKRFTDGPCQKGRSSCKKRKVA